MTVVVGSRAVCAGEGWATVTVVVGSGAVCSGEGWVTVTVLVNLKYDGNIPNEYSQISARILIHCKLV